MLSVIYHKIRPEKYPNNFVEHDHKAIKHRTQPMLGFKTFSRARILITGIEDIHMIYKGQMKHYNLQLTPPQLFHSLAV
jgi:putative transposase